MGMYQQVEDYIKAMRAYIISATGIASDRIIFAPQDIGKRKLKSKLSRGTTGARTKTIEIDNYINFYIAYGGPGVTDERTGVAHAMWGSKGQASNKYGHAMNIDANIQIDIHGGPNQAGKQFVAETSLKLRNYLIRKQRVEVQFTDLSTKDPDDPEIPFDINCWFVLQTNQVEDSSEVENLFTTGSKYRSTSDLNWLISFFNMPESGDLVKAFNEIVLEYEHPDGTSEVEWTIPLSE